MYQGLRNRIPENRRSAAALLTTAWLVLATALAAPGALAQEAAGRFIAVVGEVKVVDPAGNVRLAATGGNLMAGDSVVTGARALAQLRLADGGLISVRADTRFTLEEFSFRGQADRLGRMFVNLVQGSLRSITGLIGRTNRDGFRLETPHATIGVRGTDFETAVLPTAQHGFVPGTLSAVFQGGIYTRTDAGVVDTGVGKAVFVASRNAIPRPLPSIPDFMLQGGQPRAQGGQGGQGSEGGNFGKAAEQAEAGSERGAVETKGLPAVQKGALDTRTDSKLEASKELLINPLLTPSTSTKDTYTTTAPTKTSPTQISPTVISPSITTKSMDSAIPEATKSFETTTTPTIDSRTTLTSPQITTKPLVTSPTPAPIKTVPIMTTPIAPIAPTSPTLSPKITEPMTVSPKITAPAKISPIKTNPNAATTIKR